MPSEFALSAPRAVVSCHCLRKPCAEIAPTCGLAVHSFAFDASLDGELDEVALRQDANEFLVLGDEEASDFLLDE